MKKFEICYSLNAVETVEAETYEEAEKKLIVKLESEGIDFKNKYTWDPFEVAEEDVPPNEDKTYKVTFELEVTASDEEEAKSLAVADITHLYPTGALEGKIELINDEGEEL